MYMRRGVDVPETDARSSSSLHESSLSPSKVRVGVRLHESVLLPVCPPGSNRGATLAREAPGFGRLSWARLDRWTSTGHRPSLSECAVVRSSCCPSRCSILGGMGLGLRAAASLLSVVAGLSPQQTLLALLAIACSEESPEISDCQPLVWRRKKSLNPRTATAQAAAQKLRMATVYQPYCGVGWYGVEGCGRRSAVESGGGAEGLGTSSLDWGLAV